MRIFMIYSVQAHQAKPTMNTFLEALLATIPEWEFTMKMT